jgi:DNA-binding NtrC family response regulator
VKRHFLEAPTAIARTVLLIHDPETMPLPLASILEQEGFLVVHAHDRVQALCGIHNRYLDAVITDYSLPDITALDLLRLFKCSDQGNRVLYEIGKCLAGTGWQQGCDFPYSPNNLRFQ